MTLLLCVFAFLFGSIPWGYLIGKMKGVDLKTRGSGNIGTTNVMRVIGKKEALYTLLLDISKGFIPVFILKLFPQYSNNFTVLGIVGFLAIVGHCFTPFLKFKGGKGVATSLGVLLAYAPLAGLITIVLWILIVKITKISSVGALISFALVPLNVYFLGYSQEILIFTAMFTIIIYSRHISNIKRLFSGTEPRIGK